MVPFVYNLDVNVLYHRFPYFVLWCGKHSSIFQPLFKWSWSHVTNDCQWNKSVICFKFWSKAVNSLFTPSFPAENLKVVSSTLWYRFKMAEGCTASFRMVLGEKNKSQVCETQRFWVLVTLWLNLDDGCICVISLCLSETSLQMY